MYLGTKIVKHILQAVNCGSRKHARKDSRRLGKHTEIREATPHAHAKTQTYTHTHKVRGGAQCHSTNPALFLPKSSAVWHFKVANGAVHTCTYTRTDKRTNTHTHTHTHTYAQTNAQTYKHAHTHGTLKYGI